MMIELKFEQVKALAESVVTEFGEDYSYTDRNGEKVTPSAGACTYVHASDPDNLLAATPGCIVGQILHRAGVTIKQLAIGDSYLNDDDPMDAKQLLRELDSRGILKVDDLSKDFLQGVQSRQDDGIPWSFAVSRAIDDI